LPRRITVSTAGLVPQIATLGAFRHKVNLAVSLNATTNAVRDRVMGTINRKYPIETLLAACRAYPLPPRRRIFFEYVLLAGVNDSVDDARRLIKLLHGIRCKINLIPFNPWPGAPYERPSDETVAAFQAVLIDAHFTAFIRKSKGQQILAACGQLRSAHERQGRLVPLPS
jgi:23S rRNA (adenine2503-C2)-methyltransferase